MKHPRMFLRDNDSRKFSREDLFAEVPAGSHYSYYRFCCWEIVIYFFAGKHFHGSFRSQNYSREFSREDIFVEDRKHAFQNWFRKPQNKNIFERIDPVDSFTGTVHGKLEDVNAHGNCSGSQCIGSNKWHIACSMKCKIIFKRCCGRFHPARKFCRADFEDIF